MDAIIGIAVGIAATIAVAHYYYRRSAKKELTPYLLLSSRVFAGIDTSVRKELRFTFRGKDVADLQELQFLIANTGERAISNCIEPLTLRLPQGAEVLDASIIYRRPDNLKVDITTSNNPFPSATFIFPLLNRREFFVVKVLVSGKVEESDLSFSVLADDLPRTLLSRWLPQSATRLKKSRIRWVELGVGVLLLAFATLVAHTLMLLQRRQPTLFPYPWSSFNGSLDAAVIMLCTAGTAFFILLGLVGIFGQGLEEVFSRGPRFTLPPQLHRRGSRPDFSERLETAAVIEDQRAKGTTRHKGPPET